MTYPDYTSDTFSEECESVTDTVPKPSKLIIIGDFNAEFGTGHALWEGVLGNPELTNGKEIVISY